MNKYETIIGLEIHIQLKTKTGMFSGVSNGDWQAEPNSKTNPVELGLPGSLPTPNKQAIEWTQRLGKVLNCKLNTVSKFDRKNYFYPDLPRGYQISQYDQPFCEGGYLYIDDPESEDGYKRIGITRVHLEEDTGKSIHRNGKTYLDFNKAGTPLIELVTEPDFRSPDEASNFAKMIHEAARILDISNVDMEKGNMRLEANVSVRRVGETDLPNYRVELKNINSFRFMRNAIDYEVERQIRALEAGEVLEQETRGWDSKNNVSVLQRRKEDAHDYRYFPEPDIPPFVFDDAYFERVLADLPKMPWEIKKELINSGVRPDYAGTLAMSADKLQTLEQLKDSAELDIAELAKIIVNSKDKDEVLEKIDNKNKKPETRNLLTDQELSEIVITVLTKHKSVVEEYKAGKETVIQFLIGQVMKESNGQALPQKAKEMLKSKI